MLDVCVSILALQNDHLYHFARFHIYALIYDICFSLSVLLHSMGYTLGLSTSLPMTQFGSFLCPWLILVGTSHYVYSHSDVEPERIVTLRRETCPSLSLSFLKCIPVLPPRFVVLTFFTQPHLVLQMLLRGLNLPQLHETFLEASFLWNSYFHISTQFLCITW